MSDFTVKPLNLQAMETCGARWNRVAKPLNSLGQLEKLICQIAGLQGTADVCLDGKSALVMCADNGVVAEGISQTDASVTKAVALSIAKGTGNICRMANVAGAKVFAVDVGMMSDVDHPRILRRKCRKGTGNIRIEPAMSRSQALSAIETGIDLVRMRVRAGDHLIATGEMGIGNTTTSSAMASVLLSQPVEAVTGRGAGLSREGLSRKIEVIRDAIEKNRPDSNDALDVLSKLGGFDIAVMAGVFIGGAQVGIPILIDGFISGIAALTAQRLCPESKNAMIASHLSNEPAASMILDALGLKAILRAGMALGEGTGAVAIMPILDMALSVYRDGGTFDDIQVEAYRSFGEEK